MKAKLVFAVVIALCGTTTNVYGDIFAADNRGWWEAGGGSNNAGGPAAGREYSTSNFVGFNRNSYFTFDRSGWAGSWIVSGTFQIQSLSSGNTPGATFNIWDFTGDFNALTTNTTGGGAIHTDLQTGTQYGTTTIAASTIHSIALNAAAINDLQNGAGTHFVIGGDIPSASGTGFFGTGATEITQLDLVLQANTAPVSDPGGPYTIDPGFDLFLDGSGSFDPDASFGDAVVSWEWDVNGDSVFDVTGETPTVTWAQLLTLGITPGTSYNLGLRVTDTMGAQHLQSTLFTVNPVPEPATCTIWALAGASCGLVGWRRRKKNQQ